MRYSITAKAFFWGRFAKLSALLLLISFGIDLLASEIPALFALPSKFEISPASILNLAVAEETKKPQKVEPGLLISNPVFDFGQVEQGQLVEHTFQIENPGSLPVEIRRVVPSCGCSIAEPSQGSIGPGAKFAVKTTFDTSGFWGNKVKTFRVYTSDPRNPSLLLTLQGDVRRDISVNPAKVFFGRVSKGKDASQIITLGVNKDSSIEILEASSRSPFLQLTEENFVDKTRQGKKVQVTVKSTAPVGALKDHISVKTTSDKNPVITIPVFAQVRGDLIAEPDNISFGLKETGSSLQTTNSIKLTNSGNYPIEIVSIESDIPSISAKPRIITQGKEYEILVKLDTSNAGILRGSLIITTNHLDESQKILTIPVYGIISNKGE